MGDDVAPAYSACGYGAVWLCGSSSHRRADLGGPVRETHLGAPLLHLLLWYSQEEQECFVNDVAEASILEERLLCKAAGQRLDVSMEHLQQ